MPQRPKLQESHMFSLVSNSLAVSFFTILYAISQVLLTFYTKPQTPSCRIGLKRTMCCHLGTIWIDFTH